MCPNDPDATKKLKECEKAVMKLKFEEAIAAPESERRSIAESIDFRTIGTILTTVSYASVFFFITCYVFLPPLIPCAYFFSLKFLHFVYYFIQSCCYISLLLCILDVCILRVLLQL